jgi:hypothetical protein
VCEDLQFKTQVPGDINACRQDSAWRGIMAQLSLAYSR